MFSLHTIKLSFIILMITFITLRIMYPGYFKYTVLNVIIYIEFIWIYYGNYKKLFMGVFTILIAYSIIAIIKNINKNTPFIFTHIQLYYIPILLNLFAVRFNSVHLLKIYYVVFIIYQFITIIFYRMFRKKGII